MAYRQFSTGTWQDPWFENLSAKGKLLFIYLWTNDVCNQSGLYQISKRRIEFEVGFKPDDVFKELSHKAEWFEEYSIVWVKNFFKWQCQNPKFAIAACRSLSCVPKEIVEKFITFNQNTIEKYGIDTVSIPHASSENTLCLSVTEQKQNSNSILTDRVSGFDEFWTTYPKKVGKLEAKKAWSKNLKSRPSTESILAKLIELKKSEQWTKEHGQYIPNPATWINRGGWDDECTISANVPTPRYKELPPIPANGGYEN